MKENLQ